MMWPILTKVQYETFPALFTSQRLWTHIVLSVFLNWIIGPFIMLGLSWATLPDLPTYRTGVIMVGLARCTAMVMIWNQLAHGDGNYCAILVMINSVLQIVLYSPFAVLFINIIGNQESSIHVSYGKVAISVLIVCSSRLNGCSLPNSISVSRNTISGRGHNTIRCLVTYQQMLP